MVTTICGSMPICSRTSSPWLPGTSTTRSSPAARFISSSRRALPALFRHRGNDPVVPIIEMPPRSPAGRYRFCARSAGKNLHLRAAGGTYRFAHGGLDGVPRSAVYRRAACRQADPGSPCRCPPALQANLSAVIEDHPGKNQHAVGGVDIIAAVFTDRGDRLLPFDVRGLNVQAQGGAGG